VHADERAVHGARADRDLSAGALRGAPELFDFADGGREIGIGEERPFALGFEHAMLDAVAFAAIPGFWSTRAPASRATCTVLSAEPSSTTTTSANSHGEALRYSRTFTREAGNRLASLYAGMIMERERLKRRFIIAYFAI